LCRKGFFTPTALHPVGVARFQGFFVPRRWNITLPARWLRLHAALDTGRATRPAVPARRPPRLRVGFGACDPNAAVRRRGAPAHHRDVQGAGL